MHNIYKVSHEDSKYSSYKILVYDSDIQKVLNENFWSVGVRCEIWHFKNRYNTYNEYESDRDNGVNRDYDVNSDENDDYDDARRAYYKDHY